MRDYASMGTQKKLRTANYDSEARARLGHAVKIAREAAGFMFRTRFAKAAGIKSVRSLEYLEAGEPKVGESILFAVGRALPNWDEDTPRTILEGGPVPPTETPEPPTPRYPVELDDDFEREVWDRMREKPESARWEVILKLRSEAS
jgi:hypothetical protein